MNFLIFLIEDISMSEIIYSQAADAYVDEVSYLFKWAILTITGALIFLVTFSILNMIKSLVIQPVELLTAHIQKSKKKKDFLDSYEISLRDIALKRTYEIEQILKMQKNFQNEKRKFSL